MRLAIPLLSSRLAWRGEMTAAMPRVRTSSALSRPVHWLMGRPEARGTSQASAVSRQTARR